MLHTKSNDGNKLENCYVKPMIRSSSRVRCIDQALAKMESIARDRDPGKVTISSKFRDLHAASPEDSLTGSVVGKLACVSRNRHPVWPVTSDLSSSSSSDIKPSPLKSPRYICRSSDSLQSSCNSNLHYAAVDVRFPTSPVGNTFLTLYEASTQQRKCHTSKKSAYHVDAYYSSKSHSLKDPKSSIPSQETSATVKSVLVCNPCIKSDASLKENFKSEIDTTWIKEKVYSRNTNDLRNNAKNLKSNKCVSLTEESQHSRALTHVASKYYEATSYRVAKGSATRELSRKCSTRQENNLMDRCRFKDHDSTKWPESESLSQDNQPFTFSGATSMDPETFDNKVYDYESTTSSDLDVASLRLVPGDGHRIRRRYADDRAFGGGEEDIDAGLFQRHDEASCASVRFHRRRMKSRNSTVRKAPSADLMNHCKNVVTRAKGSRNDCLNSSFEPYNQEIIERRTALNSSTYNSTDNYATSEELEPQIKVCTANSSAQTLNSNCITKNTVQKVPFRFKNRVVDCSKEEVEDNRMTWESGQFQSANRASSTVRRKSLHHRTKAQRRKTSQMQLPTGLQGKVKESIPEVILSQNPYKDFRHSMISMILEKDLKRTTDLEELLQCYLSLNAPYFSSLIIQAFSELWFQIFGDRS